MIEDKYIELINREIDGMNSPANSIKLQEYLNHNPDAQMLYNDFKEMSNILSHSSEIEPPSNLKKNILNAIPVNMYSVRTNKFSFSQILNLFYFSGKPRFAYVFSAGVLFGIMIVSIVFNIYFKNNSMGVNGLSGTIGPIPSTATFNKTENIDLKGENFVGDVALSCSGDAVLLNLNLNSSKDLDVEINFNEKELRVMGFNNTGDVEGGLKVNVNSMHFTVNGKNSYQVVLGCKTSTPSNMNLRVFSSNSIVYMHTFTVNVTGKNDINETK